MIEFEEGVLDKVRAVTGTPGWKAEPVRTFSSGAAVKLTAGPQGRGAKRPTYLIIADTLADAFRALGECLTALGQTEAF